jgi:hypothetical protein
MVKPLSAQLADLSVRAKNAEDASAATQKQAHDKAIALREQARAAATAAIEKVNQDIKSAGENVTSQWNALKTKVAPIWTPGDGAHSAVPRRHSTYTNL